MKNTLALILSAALLVFGATAYAGGPVIVEDVEEVVAEKPATSVGILPILIGIVVICAVICNGDDDNEQLKVKNNS